MARIGKRMREVLDYVAAHPGCALDNAQRALAPRKTYSHTSAGSSYHLVRKWVDSCVAAGVLDMYRSPDHNHQLVLGLAPVEE